MNSSCFSFVEKALWWRLLKASMTQKLKGADGIIDFMRWHRKILSFGELWPTNIRGFKFYSVLAYGVIHTSLVICDFMLIVGDLGLMIEIARELTFLTISMMKVLVVRYSSSLPKLIREGKADEEDIYKNDEEKRIYLSYVDTGLRSFKMIFSITIPAIVANFLKTLLIYVIAELLGASPGFRPPYHTKRFFNITNLHTYLIVYAAHSPMVYISFCYVVVTCLIASLIYDMCGQLSVLAYRIRNTKFARATLDNRLYFTIRDIVEKHNKIIWTCNTVNVIFNIALFVELLLSTIMQGLCMYKMLLNYSFGDVILLLTFLLYTLGLLIQTYGYCVAGNCLTQESINFHNAWYECEWYDMPPRCQKMIIICMVRAAIPLNLTGGGIYTYSLESFTGVIKSSMAYVSMLRQII